MNLELRFKEFYPHPIAAVWAALTDPNALAVWLMRNDFEPRVGKRFTFRDEPTAEWRGWIDCEVIALEPPCRMVWSWQSTADDQPTKVTIELRAVAGGTELTLVHSGETDPARRSRYASGWPGKFAALHSLLSTAEPTRT